MSEERDDDIIIERFDAIGCSNCQHPIDTEGVPPFTLATCPACGTQMKVPARFANFILLDEFGKGGMGAVYKAYDETLGRAVALKVMQKFLGRDRTFIEQFLQEARALAAINHPNIVQIYSYGEEAGQPYIVMELVDGGRLDKIHEKKKILDEKFVLKTTKQVIQGLQAAHAAGMTHGDIKPANILFDKAGHAKVADFGLARFHGETGKPGEIWGTPFYVAPEVVRGQAPDQQADIYSLGATLYHLLAGEPPWNGETVTDTVLLRFKEPAPDLRLYNPRISEQTAHIILRMLEMDAFSRYPTYESLLRDVSAAYDHLTATPKPEPKGKTTVLGVIIGIIVLGLLAGGGWLTNKQLQKRKLEQAVTERFDADKALGRYKQQLRDGELAWRPVFPEGVTAASIPAERRTIRGERVYYVTPDTWNRLLQSVGQPAAVVQSQKTEWDIPTHRDAYISGNREEDPFRDRSLLLVMAGNDLAEARKIYLQFSLKDVPKEQLASITLQLTAGRKGTRRKKQDYKLRLWGVHENVAKEWTAQEETTMSWDLAPANAPQSAGGMNARQATLLAEIDMPANPETGDRILIGNETSISKDAFIHFVEQLSGDELTLVLTMDEQSEQKVPWRITAVEDTRFKPPTLIIKKR